MTLNPNQPVRPNHEKDPSAPDDHQLPPFPKYEHDTRIPEDHQRDDSGIVQDKLASRPDTHSNFWTPAKKIGAGAMALIATGGAAFGIGKAMGGSDEKTLLTEPSSPVATAPNQPGVTPTVETTPTSNPTEVLKTTTFHEYVKSHSFNEMQPLQERIVADVNIPSTEWNALSVPDRATRMANYVEFKTEMCASGNLIDETVEKGNQRLDAVNWSPYVTKDTMEAAGKGDKNALNKIETIRRMYECTIGASEDNKNNYVPQIKENLMQSFYARKSQDTVYRDDYVNAGGHSMLNVDTMDQYGATVTPMPAFNGVPFGGVQITAPSAAWVRPPQLNPERAAIYPISTSTGKAILTFGY